MKVHQRSRSLLVISEPEFDGVLRRESMVRRMCIAFDMASLKRQRNASKPHETVYGFAPDGLAVALRGDRLAEAIGAIDTLSKASCQQG
ncbi:MAG TPA: hypothetical protein V6D20_05405 [Candidatus Obscuribacterales bacterium]